MRIVVSYQSRHDDTALHVPESLSKSAQPFTSNGIDGEIIECIYEIVKECLGRTAEIVAIAGFIYTIIHDRKGTASINGKTVSRSQSKEDITQTISISLEESASEQEDSSTDK